MYMNNTYFMVFTWIFCSFKRKDWGESQRKTEKRFFESFWRVAAKEKRSKENEEKGS